MLNHKKVGYSDLHDDNLLNHPATPVVYSSLTISRWDAPISSCGEESIVPHHLTVTQLSPIIVVMSAWDKNHMSTLSNIHAHHPRSCWCHQLIDYCEVQFYMYRILIIILHSRQFRCQCLQLVRIRPYFSGMYRCMGTMLHYTEEWMRNQLAVHTKVEL